MVEALLRIMLVNLSRDGFGAEANMLLFSIAVVGGKLVRAYPSPFLETPFPDYLYVCLRSMHSSYSSFK